jgi:hypothetical protein
VVAGTAVNVLFRAKHSPIESDVCNHRRKTRDGARHASIRRLKAISKEHYITNLDNAAATRLQNGKVRAVLLPLSQWAVWTQGEPPRMLLSPYSERKERHNKSDIARWTPGHALNSMGFLRGGGGVWIHRDGATDLYEHSAQAQ